MTIDLKTTPSHPFGANIHFVYQIETEQLLFLHSDFAWVVSPGEDVHKSVIATIVSEDLPGLAKIYQMAVMGQMDGSVVIQLNTRREGVGCRFVRCWLIINPQP